MVATARFTIYMFVNRFTLQRIKETVMRRIQFEQVGLSPGP